MNKIIFKNDFTLKKKSLIVWTSVCIGVMLFLMAFFPLFKNVISELSAEITKLMNIEGMEQSFSIYTYASGYFVSEIGVMYQLVAVVFAAMVGIGVWSKEEKNKTAEYVLTLPITRKEVWSTKLLGIVYQILIFSSIFSIVSTAAVLFMDLGVTGSVCWIDLLGVVIGLVEITILQLIIGLTCFALSGIMKGTLNMGVAIALSLGLYIFDFIISIFTSVFANRWPQWLVNTLSKVTPFGSTNPLHIWKAFSQHEAAEIKYYYISLIFLAFWVVCTIGLIIYSYKRFEKKDIPN